MGSDSNVALKTMGANSQPTRRRLKMRTWISNNPSVIVTIVAMLLAFAAGYGAFTARITTVEALAEENKTALKIECERSRAVDSSRSSQMVGIQRDMQYVQKTIDDLKAGQVKAIKKIDDVADKFDSKFDELRRLIIKHNQ